MDTTAARLLNQLHGKMGTMRRAAERKTAWLWSKTSPSPRVGGVRSARELKHLLACGLVHLTTFPPTSHPKFMIQLFAETMSFGLRLRERAIDAIKSKNSEIQCWLEDRLQEFTVLVRRQERTCHRIGPSTACVAKTKSIWQELREIWPNNVAHLGRSQQYSRCQFDLRKYALDTEPSPAQPFPMVFYG